MFQKCCSSSALFCGFLSTTIQDDCKRRTLFRVFRGHMSSLKVFISSSVLVTIDSGTSSVVASPFCLVELWLAIFWAGDHRIFLFSSCRKRKRFFCASSRIRSSVQYNDEPLAHFKKRFCLFLTLQKVTMVLKTF